MKRRTLISVALLSLSGGCVASFGGGTSKAQHIENREFTIFEPEREQFASSPSATEKPLVSFDSNARQVTIRGALYVGSGSCNKAALKSLSYDESTETLTARVGSGEKQHAGNSCSSDESADAYRLVVTMKEQLPNTVSVEQTGDPSAKSVTVERP